ncbi:MAG: hypothetical protein KIT36_24900, partial [Alphaproteobacteria bacterium]|nr:hypothetical protein [Alphaproteobacteria bacterium]
AAPADAAAPPRSAWTWGSGDDVAARNSDPTQSNRITSRTLPPAAGARSDEPPPATPPAAPQQEAARPATPPAATPPVAAAPPAAKPRTTSGPVMPQPRTIKAEVDSTLELRGPTGEVLATTFLRAGSSYTVPAHVAYVLAPAAR